MIKPLSVLEGYVVQFRVFGMAFFRSICKYLVHQDIIGFSHYTKGSAIVANLITILRFPLIITLVILLFLSGPYVVLGCVPFLIIIILMDTLDGNLARRRGETSLLGSALDIAADRTLELFLWVVFASLQLIPVAVPLIVIVRGVIVDAIRAVGIGQGIPPFKQVSSPISRFLVTSNAMRTSYSISKSFAFSFLIIDLALRQLSHPWSGWIHLIALALTWIAVLICIARGVPVLVDGAIMLHRSDQTRSAVSQHQPLD